MGNEKGVSWVKMGLVGTSILIAVMMLSSFIETVPAGNVGVGTLFGKVKKDPFSEGMHFVNPFLKVTLFDSKQKTQKEQMGVPSKDQLITSFDISIQYRLIKEKAPEMLKETGTPSEVMAVHMLPLLRSQLRELGKTVEKAEDFYIQSVQQRIQTELMISMSALSRKGIKVEALLIRNVILPKIITDAVLRKKKAAQEAEKAKEELKKFKVDQERKEARAEADKRSEIIEAQKKKEVLLISANADLEAAKINAQRKREVLLISANATLEASRIEAESIVVKANAQAEANKRVIEVLTLDGYLKLESMGALTKIQNGNHLIIMDPEDVSPLPFLNLAEKVK